MSRFRRWGRIVPVIALTDNAAVKVKELVEAEGERDLALRVAVRPGGCSGFSYEMFFDTDVADRRPHRRLRRRRVVVDPSSAQLLTGATLDYKDGLQQAGLLDRQPQRPAHLRLRPVLLVGPHLLLPRGLAQRASTASSTGAPTSAHAGRAEVSAVVRAAGARRAPRWGSGRESPPHTTGPSSTTGFPCLHGPPAAPAPADRSSRGPSMSVVRTSPATRGASTRNMTWAPRRSPGRASPAGRLTPSWSSRPNRASCACRRPVRSPASHVDSTSTRSGCTSGTSVCTSWMPPRQAGGELDAGAVGVGRLAVRHEAAAGHGAVDHLDALGAPGRDDAGASESRRSRR